MDEFILNDYFDWLYFTALPNSTRSKFRKLLALLHSIILFN